MQRLADVSRPITAPSSLTLKTAPFNRPEMAASLGCIGREVRFSHRRVYQNHCRLPILDCRLPFLDCRLPIANCRLPIGVCSKSYKVHNSKYSTFISITQANSVAS